jgi:hypothetical protein
VNKVLLRTRCYCEQCVIVNNVLLRTRCYSERVIVNKGLLRTSRTARLKCAGAPSRMSCMYHIRVLTARVTASTNFGRSCKRKSR